MLQIKHLSKIYRTGSTEVHALDDVSLDLRDNEFVAILGPSGSGKTTLLNIIGGLDRYDSGDLIINGTSTKKYRDRDWDSYRNHAIGFVFQSYNLIMHQSVLSNVELALTISGISGAERRERAKEALRKVGLERHMDKRPNQLSGGQMQRVAIARALVNNPRIVLADEPTGALDTATSVQIMDILKEVAKDRLVVMVTHNPSLAKQYATRIVTIRDGKITDDSNPYTDAPEEKVVSGRSFGKSSMSFFTAITLSFNNLKAKAAQTFLVSFAGSIGIIGIALVLALSTGISQYVSSVEAATLSMYPLEITQTGIDLSTLVTQTSSSLFGTEDNGDAVVNKVGVNNLAKQLFSGASQNDLASLKAYLDSGKSDIMDYASSIQYNYNVKPLIYRQDETGTYQLNPNTMLSSMLTSIIDVSSLMDGAIGESLFHPLPDDSSLYMDNYDLKSGRWPQNDHELVLVLSSKGEVTDFLLYELGILDPTKLQDMINNFSGSSSNSILGMAQSALGSTAQVGDGSSDGSSGSGSGTGPGSSSAGGGSVDPGSEGSGANGAAATSSGNASAAAASSGSSSTSGDASGNASGDASEQQYYSYDTFIGRKFKLVDSSNLYEYNSEYGTWTDRSDDEDYVADAVSKGEDLTIVGVIQPKDTENSDTLQTGIAYPHQLVTDLINRAESSDAVQVQMADPDTDLFTGKPFGDNSSSGLDLNGIVTLDHDAVAKAFSIDTDALKSSGLADTLKNTIVNGMGYNLPDFTHFNLADLVDEDSLKSLMPSLTDQQVRQWIGKVKIHATQDQMEDLFKSLAKGYLSYAANDPSTNYSALSDSFREYLKSDDAQSLLKEELGKIIKEKSGSLITQDQIKQVLTDTVQAYINWVDETNAGRSQDDQLDIYSAGTFQQFLGSQEGQSAIENAAAQLTPSNIDITDEDVAELTQAVANGYESYAKDHSMPQLSKLTSSFADYLDTDDAAAILEDAASEMIDSSALQDDLQQEIQSAAKNTEDQVSSQVQDAASAVIAQATSNLENVLMQAMVTVSGYVNTNMNDFFKIDQGLFAQAIRTNLSPSQLKDLLSQLLTGGQDSYTSNLEKLGYEDLNSPYSIDIYAKDFNSKGQINKILDHYNDQMRAAGEVDKVITYSDIVASMMQSVTDMVHTISKVLIGFVGISLVVSSIMIGVITYISVLERRKEIGILRALGASKNNISQVFNAETFLSGTLSGLLGVGITYCLLPLVNHIIRHKTAQPVTAMLMPKAAILLVLLSIALTLLAGLIPSGKAAKSDPVTVLRSE